ncbi:MAG: 50S ribosomal protein L10, partial [Microterricola sp.]
MANKEATVAELTNLFETSTAVLLTEYRGLTVAQLKQLRGNIRQDANYAVVKNTLTKIAANNAGITTL